MHPGSVFNPAAPSDIASSHLLSLDFELLNLYYTFLNLNLISLLITLIPFFYNYFRSNTFLHFIVDTKYITLRYHGVLMHMRILKRDSINLIVLVIITLKLKDFLKARSFNVVGFLCNEGTTNALYYKLKNNENCI